MRVGLRGVFVLILLLSVWASGGHPAWAGARRRQTWLKYPPAAAVTVGRLPGLRSGRAAAARSLVAYGCVCYIVLENRTVREERGDERAQEGRCYWRQRQSGQPAALRPTAACMAPPRLPRTATLRSCLRGIVIRASFVSFVSAHGHKCQQRCVAMLTAIDRNGRHGHREYQ